MTEPCVVLITAPEEAVALTLARALVDEHLAACVNLVPAVRSVYWWQGQRCEDPEWLLIVKTDRASFAALEARVRSLHPYQVPEIVALPIVAGSEPYLTWIGQTLELGQELQS